jgi:uncharacterized protein (TIGR02001 family)
MTGQSWLLELSPNKEFLLLNSWIALYVFLTVLTFTIFLNKGIYVKITKKPLIMASLLVSAFGLVPMAYAEDAAPAVAAAVSPHTLTSNIGFYTDYTFRGISYAKERGAIQGGFDYSNVNGLYAGIWGSNVDKNALAGNTLEIDLYGGYVYQINPDLGINVGFLQFLYPNNNKPVGSVGTGGSTNTTELNAAVTYKWLTLKQSVAVSNFFGANNALDGRGDSRGSGYTELNFNYQLPVQAINLALHVGHQTVRGRSEADYTDYLVGINKDFEIAGSKGWNAGVNFTTTDANSSVYVDTSTPGFKTAEGRAIGFIKRTF